MDKTEFTVGDIVTFKPYDVATKGRVLEVVPASKHSFVEDDTRIFYRLTGAHPEHPLTTVTSGKSIVESQYYEAVEIGDSLK